MAHAFEIKRGDRLPVLSGLARIRATGDPIDAPASSVLRFMMRPSGAAAPSVDATAAATIVNASRGQWAFVWASGHTASTGYFQGEFELTHIAGQKRTVPGKGYISIYIDPDIA